MSFNVRMFNHFKSLDEKNIEKKIFSFIEDNKPDVFVVQENSTSEKYDLEFPYKYIDKKNVKNHFGMAIYSKLPIVNRGSLKLKNTSNNIIFADILKRKRYY